MSSKERKRSGDLRHAAANKITVTPIMINQHRSFQTAVSGVGKKTYSLLTKSFPSVKSLFAAC